MGTETGPRTTGAETEVAIVVGTGTGARTERREAKPR